MVLFWSQTEFSSRNDVCPVHDCEIPNGTVIWRSSNSEIVGA